MKKKKNKKKNTHFWFGLTLLLVDQLGWKLLKGADLVLKGKKVLTFSSTH